MESHSEVVEQQDINPKKEEIKNDKNRIQNKKNQSSLFSKASRKFLNVVSGLALMGTMGATTPPPSLTIGGAESKSNLTSAEAGEIMPHFIEPGGYPDPKYNFYSMYDGSNGLSGQHEAQDFITTTGLPFPVRAVASGTVDSVEYDGGPSQGGGILRINLDPPYSNFRVNYVHMQSSNQIFEEWKPGMKVFQGEIIGDADGSGAHSGSIHLHLEVWESFPDGSVDRIDPMPLMAPYQP